MLRDLVARPMTDSVNNSTEVDAIGFIHPTLFSSNWTVSVAHPAEFPSDKQNNYACVMFYAAAPSHQLINMEPAFLL